MCQLLKGFIYKKKLLRFRNNHGVVSLPKFRTKTNPALAGRQLICANYLKGLSIKKNYYAFEITTELFLFQNSELRRSLQAIRHLCK